MVSRLQEQLYLRLSNWLHLSRLKSRHLKTRDRVLGVLGRLCRHCGNGCSNGDQSHRDLLLGLRLGLLMALEVRVDVFPVVVSIVF